MCSLLAHGIGLLRSGRDCVAAYDVPCRLLLSMPWAKSTEKDCLANATSDEQRSGIRYFVLA